MCKGSNTPNAHPLFDEEPTPRDWQRATAVVDVYHCFGSFLRSVDVLLESRPHTGDALIDAAPSLNDTSLLLLLVDFEINWLLADGENLFEFHAF